MCILFFDRAGVTMANEPEDLAPESWHRYFAVEGNNLAWSLASRTERTADEMAQMLDAAHAAAWHWKQVGTDLNVMRAKTLLAEVHALSGFGRSALSLAEEIRRYFLARETDDWEIAFVHTIHAHAAAVAGEAETHRFSYIAAQKAIDDIADAEDRRIVLETFMQVPDPFPN